jgi:hypothetical protein
MTEPQTCRCGLTLAEPLGVDWWRPAVDPEPSRAEAPAVVVYGENPELDRWIRMPGGWCQRGLRANFYVDRTPPFRWEQIGCWAGNSHCVLPTEVDP